ncbi:MAG: hypothetical protein RL748_4188 [Pseudomonadota bacterium]
MPPSPPLPRRAFLQQLGAAASLTLPGWSMAQPQRSAAIINPDSARPQMPSGVMSGDTSATQATIWSRSDRPARMLVDVANNASFNNARQFAGALALPSNDYSSRLDVSGLKPGETTYYRVRYQDLQNPAAYSETLSGSLQVPGGGRDIRFAFSGDEAGQGWGINPAFGGYRMYETMRRFKPDFFIHSGDQIYADGVLKESVTLDDGSIWNNLVTPGKAKVAQTLDDFRANFAYNLLDQNKRRFAAEVPFLVQWDDHEVRNNWFPGQSFGAKETRYQERSLDVLAQRARRAMFEYNPFRIDPLDPQRIYRMFNYGPLLEVFMLDQRSYRAPNSANRQSSLDADAAFLGQQQLAWLKQSLLRSRSTWKVIASDMPLSIVVDDANPDVTPGGYEASANAENGKPLGRELELASLLSFIKQHKIRNVVWVTADVHYAQATFYAPEQAAFTDFTPFWEFVAGPLNAGTFGPNQTDHTFGPQVRFCSVEPGMKQNRPPTEGRQYFGLGKIDATSRVLTMALHDIEGKLLYQVDIAPQV